MAERWKTRNHVLDSEHAVETISCALCRSITCQYKSDGQCTEAGLEDGKSSQSEGTLEKSQEQEISALTWRRQDYILSVYMLNVQEYYIPSLKKKRKRSFQIPSCMKAMMGTVLRLMLQAEECLQHLRIVYHISSDTRSENEIMSPFFKGKDNGIRR